MFHIQNDDSLLTSKKIVLDSRTFQNRFAELYFTLKLGEKTNQINHCSKAGREEKQPLIL